MEKKNYGGEPTVNQIVNGSRRQLHYLYPDNTEMLEEFDINTNECLLRKWKKTKAFGEAEWEFEIGQPLETNFDPETQMIAPSNKNPLFLRKDTDTRFEWRIRNLPYPKETYQIEVDHNKQDIVLRTTNKKYYKRIDIPDMKRLDLVLEDSEVAWKYQNNTVIISYDKP